MPTMVSSAAAGSPVRSANHRTATMTATAARTSNSIVSGVTPAIVPDAARAPAQRGSAGERPLHAVLVDAEAGEDAGAVLGLQQRQQDVAGADVGVPESESHPERELQSLPRVRVERDQRGHLVGR